MYRFSCHRIFTYNADTEPALQTRPKLFQPPPWPNVDASLTYSRLQVASDLNSSIRYHTLSISSRTRSLRRLVARARGIRLMLYLSLQPCSMSLSLSEPEARARGLEPRSRLPSMSAFQRPTPNVHTYPTLKFCIFERVTVGAPGNENDGDTDTDSRGRTRVVSISGYRLVKFQLIMYRFLLPTTPRRPKTPELEAW